MISVISLVSRFYKYDGKNRHILAKNKNKKKCGKKALLEDDVYVSAR